LKQKTLSRNFNFYPLHGKGERIGGLHGLPTRTKVSTVEDTEESVSIMLQSEGAVYSDKLLDSKETGKRNSQSKKQQSIAIESEMFK
jgi:hypothetical protein